jgi:hypothetical protein
MEEIINKIEAIAKVNDEIIERVKRDRKIVCFQYHMKETVQKDGRRVFEPQEVKVETPC